MTDETRAIKCDCVYEEFCNLVNGGGIFLPKPCAYRKNVNDFVEAVRCKDCTNKRKAIAENGQMIFCSIWGRGWYRVDPNDFCSYGERRTNE